MFVKSYNLCAISCAVLSIASGHMESHVGKYSVLVVLRIHLFQTKKFWSILIMEEDQQSLHFVLITCKTLMCM